MEIEGYKHILHASDGIQSIVIDSEAEHPFGDELHVGDRVETIPLVRAVPELSSKGPYEARICKGIPADCCDYGVISLETGLEVCRVWKEDDVRLITDILNGYSSAVG